MKRNNKNTNQPVADFFERKQRLLLFIAMAASVLMSILMFNVKASLGGDDCDYVLFADKFCRDFSFPGFRGPLYPIVMSPFIFVFGVNLVLLKALSAIFIILSIWFLYKSFVGKIKARILMPALLLTSVCPYLFFYAGYTYSEPFFMFVQALFVYFFSKYFIDGDKQLTLRHDLKKYLIFGFLILAMGLTRSIGFGALGAAILFFAAKRRLKDLLYTLSASGIAFFSFQIFKGAVWPDAGSAYDLQNYLAKNYYNLNQGMEDFSGFVERLAVNSNVYLSKFLCMFMGLRPEDTVGLQTITTVLIYCLFAVYRRNAALLFIGIYAGVMNFASFVILQKVWMQDRLIVVYYPLIILFFLGGLFYLFTMGKNKNSSGKFWLRYIYPSIVAILLIGTLSHAKTKIGQNFPVLKQNITGDKLDGLTPDWKNFILMSQWASKNIDKNENIASRKPSISYIYTGREFEGIFNVPTVPVDSLPTVAPEGKTILTVAIGAKTLPFMSPDLRYIISCRKCTFDILNDEFAGLYIVDTDKLDEIISLMRSMDMTYSTDAEKFKEQCKNQTASVSIYDPDQLLYEIERRDIKYLLLASIRLNSKYNNGEIVNAVHRYVYFIDLKYKNRFSIVHKIGDSEPCELIKYSPN